MILLAAAALPFAPPLDRPIRYAIEERRGDERYRMTETVTFSRDGDGYVVAIVAGGVAADGPAKARVETGVRPWIGVPLRIRLSPDGTAIEPKDVDETWRRLVAGLAAMGADATAAAFARMPAADRDAQILHAADDVIATSLPPLEPGGTATVADGIVVRRGTARYVSLHRLSSPDGAVEIIDTVDLAPDTGLVASRRRIRFRADGTTAGETRIDALSP